jgi:lipocalin
MKIEFKSLFILITAFLFFSCSNSKNMVDSKTVDSLDIKKFIGKCYEIAGFPYSFEKGLVGVTATYSFRDDQKIKVVNQAYKNSLDGKLSVATGKAKIPDLNQPSKLKVSFFWFFYADYFVMDKL